MLKFSSAYREAKDAGNLTRPLIIITTVRTRYIFGKTTPTETEIGIFGDVGSWDGTHKTGNGGTFGGFPVSAAEALVIDFGSIRKTLVPQGNDLLSSLTQTERGAYSVNLDNTTAFFSELLGDNRGEPLLGQRLSIYQAFLGNTSEDFIEIFSGEITSLTLSASKLLLVAESLTSIQQATVSGTPQYAYGLTASKLASDTQILLHSNDPDGSTTFVDSSPNGFSVTVSGTPSHSTASAKFGTSSVRLGPGEWIQFVTPQDYISYTDFTAELFLYVPSALTAVVYPFFWLYDMWLIIPDGAKAVLHVSGGDFPGYCTGYDVNAHLGEWLHLACITTGTGLNLMHRFYVNGALINTHIGALGAFGSATGTYMQNATAAQTVYIDEFRVSSVARDPDIFPPTSPYGGTINPVMAQETFTHAQAAVLFSSATWSCVVNFRKDSLADSGVLFQMENQAGNAVTLEIGVDASNHLYCATGQDVEGTPDTTTYTSSQTLNALAVGKPINARVYFDSTAGEITFTTNGTSDTQTASENYDTTGTDSEKVTIGYHYGGTILNVNFSNRAWWVNTENDDTLLSLPDILGGLDLPLVNGAWSTWQ